jgi:periplasmic mercuric ion binding protein
MIQEFIKRINMKNSRNFLMAFSIVFSLFYACSGNSPEKEETKEVTITKKEVAGEEAKTIASIGIEGMTCSVGCAGKIEKTVAAMDGVLNCKVNFDTKTANIEFDDSRLSENQIISAIKEINKGQYKISKVEIEKTVIQKSTTDEKNSTSDKKNINKNKEKTTEEQVSFTGISFPNIFDAFTKLYRL